MHHAAPSRARARTNERNAGDEGSVVKRPLTQAEVGTQLLTSCRGHSMCEYRPMKPSTKLDRTPRIARPDQAGAERGKVAARPIPQRSNGLRSWLAAHASGFISVGGARPPGDGWAAPFTAWLDVIRQLSTGRAASGHHASIRVRGGLPRRSKLNAVTGDAEQPNGAQPHLPVLSPPSLPGARDVFASVAAGGGMGDGAWVGVL